jgi:hypothetical protein
MELVKRAISDTLVAKSTQHVFRKYALAASSLSCVRVGLDWDEQNHRLLKNQYYQLLQHFHRALHFVMLPRMEPSSDAQWFGNVTYALSFWNSPHCFHKILRKHKNSFCALFVSLNDTEKQTASSIFYTFHLRWVRKSTFYTEVLRKCQLIGCS